MAISLGGGGSASQVNETIDINSAENLITLADGRVYLKGGVTETNVSAYPDATAAISYTGTSFSVASEGLTPIAIAWDGTFFWVIQGNSNVSKYNASGVYQNVNWTASGVSQPYGMTSDGSHLWISSLASDRLYKFTTAGVSVTNFPVASQDNTPTGLTWDGTYLWVVGYTNKAVFKYNAAGVYQNVSFSVNAQATQPYGIAYDGTHFWVADDATNTVYQYTTAGVYTGINFSTASQETSLYGLTSAGSALWVIGPITDTAYKYQNQIGVGSQGGTEYGNQNYVRIK